MSKATNWAAIAALSVLLVATTTSGSVGNNASDGEETAYTTPIPPSYHPTPPYYGDSHGDLPEGARRVELGHAWDDQFPLVSQLISAQVGYTYLVRTPGGQAFKVCTGEPTLHYSCEVLKPTAGTACNAGWTEAFVARYATQFHLRYGPAGLEVAKRPSAPDYSAYGAETTCVEPGYGPLPIVGNLAPYFEGSATRRVEFAADGIYAYCVASHLQGCQRFIEVTNYWEREVQHLSPQGGLWVKASGPVSFHFKVEYIWDQPVPNPEPVPAPAPPYNEKG